MVILVSEDSNRYAHLFLIEREYFGLACAAGKILHTTEFSDFLEYTHHF
jgi:hypothetical protein